MNRRPTWRRNLGLDLAVEYQVVGKSPTFPGTHPPTVFNVALNEHGIVDGAGDDASEDDAPAASCAGQ